MLVIGLVGGVASGKSFVAECFEQLGAEILNADELGHQVLDQPEVISEIRSIWPSVINQAGTIDRKALAKIVFEPSEDPGVSPSLQILERITHPRIGAKVKQQLADFRTRDVPVVVLDAPVMLKAGWQEVCDRIVFVQTDLPARLQRAATRGWDRNELLKRESFQTSMEEKRKCATDIVDNSGTKQETCRQVKTLWQSWNLSPNPTRNPTS